MFIKKNGDQRGNLPTASYFLPLGRYQKMCKRAMEEPEAFWSEQAQVLQWDQPWDKILDWQPPYGRWFTGGRLNASVQCVDRHAQSWRKDKVAIHWEGETGDTRTLSYGDLYEEVNDFAAALKKLGIGKGDRVTIYLPMIPELTVAMLACARLGAVHSVIFSGFSSQAIADRVNDSNSRLVITATGGYRRGKVLPLKDAVDEAALSCPDLEKVLVIKYTDYEAKFNPERDVWYDELLGTEHQYVAPESMESTDPLFILYTSGTTGKPKGILHGTGGYLVWTAKTLQWAFNPDDNTVWWCTADAGWITGHSYVIYAPLALGLTSVIYEGAPDYPTINRWWNIVDKYGVTALYTSPTAIRMFMKSGEEWLAEHNLSTLEVLGTVGEAINPEAWGWFYRNIGKENCPIVDTWWQTEAGGFMISPSVGIQGFPLKPGSATLPMPGIDAVVVDNNGKEVPANTTGYIVIRRPWPGMMLDVYGASDLYKQVYWSRFPGWYMPGDFAMQDEDGYWWLLGRADEVIKVAGHRISTAELEHATVGHTSVAEAAVAAKPDDVKGESVVLFVTLREGTLPSDSLKQEITKHLRAAIGTVATPDEVLFVDKLPKTRSGKIMRRVLKAVASGTGIGDVTSLDDQTSVQEIQDAYEELKRVCRG